MGATPHLVAQILSAPDRMFMPILTFPGAHIAGTTVREMVTDPVKQCDAEIAVHDRFQTPFVMSAMDLSVEAEAFGATIRMEDWEVPTVIGRRVMDMAGIEALDVPEIGPNRTSVYLSTIRGLRSKISDAIVLGGMIGPFSLAGRLFGVSEALAETMGEPEMMHALLKKTTAFLTAYARAFKESGAHGVIIAEPTAGLMSPASMQQFSAPYIRHIATAVNDTNFQVILHNCGARIGHLKPSLETGVRIFHFGKPMDIATALAQVPDDIVLCGNLDPSEVFANGTIPEVRMKTQQLLKATAQYKNFVISSGCDIPAQAPMQNIFTFFTA
ncbi:MAG: uroporphyrinogen-III decarboxylase [Bacteroidetes bacterium]|nr:uroporphyrinogen-III decarboxylase [Bacteroidota bacterium]